MRQKTIAAIVALALIIACIYAGCEMSVNDPVRNVPIFSPYISVQPASHSFTVGTSWQDAMPLKVEVWEWDRLDGSLGYQWYGFETLEEFYKDEADPIAGATGASFTPSSAALKTSAGSKNYFYVVVSNNNSDAIGDKKASLKSDVAIISFSDSGAPAFPEISQNPGNSAYTIGRSAAIAPLDVRATAPAAESGFSTALSYQWYSFTLEDGFDSDGNPQGTLIQGANTRTYLPGIEDMSVGENYFYVVVTNVKYNTGGGEVGRSQQYSLPAVINMGLGEKAAAPRIDGQPRNLLYFTDATLDANSPKLSVEAVSVDRGALSYQWYKYTSAADANGTLIDDATDAEFLPDVSTTSIGTAYYRVVVTNTNELVTGATTDTAASKIATVRVAASGSLSENLTITVDPSVRFQYIRGYGGMEVAWANFPETLPEDTENMYNPDILGYNILRIMIPPSHVNIEEAMDQLTTSHRQYYYENAKIVNKYNGYILASPWSPPKEWKSNKSINGGGNLVHSYYKQYANYLRAFARLMSNKGAPIFAISIQNEPNYVAGYDGCEWEGTEMRDFFKTVGRFTQGVRGFGGGKVTPAVLTMNGESANTPEINFPAIDDPASFAAIDLFARHVYGEQTKNLWTSRPQVQQSGKEVWMTEHNINSASSTAFPNDYTWNYIWPFMNDVDLVMRISNENAFVWWASKRFYSYIGDNEAGSISGSILPRGWGLSHYAKFTIDSTRVGATVTGTLGGNQTVSATNVNYSTFSLDNVSVRITAYEFPNGDISLVMWTPTGTSGSGGYSMGNVKIKLPQDFVIRSMTAMLSDTSSVSGTDPATNITNAASRITAGENAVTIGADRNTAYVNVPGSRILSVKFIKEE